MPVAGADEFDEPRGGGGAELCGQQIKAEREQVAGLRVAEHAACGGDKLAGECGADLSEQRGEAGGIAFFPQLRGDLAQQFRAVREVGCADHVLWRGAVLGAGGIDGEPVAEERVGPDEIPAGFFQEGEMPDHRGVVIGEDFCVAGEAPDVPRDDDAGVAPAGVSVFENDVRREVGEGAVGALAVAHGAHPLREERAGIHVVERGGREDLGVAAPAEALVALRAVGGEVEEVSLLPAHDAALEPVDERIGALKGAGVGERGVDDDGGECAGRGRDAGDLDVAETVEGEARLPRFLAAACADVAVGGAGAAQARGVEGAVGFEHFAKAQRDRGAAFRANGQARPAGDILREVEDEHAGLWLGDGDGCALFHAADGRARFFAELDRRRGEKIDGEPIARCEARVAGLAVIERVRADRSGGGLPARVGDEVRFLAAVVRDEFGEERGIKSVAQAELRLAEDAAVPAVAEHDVDRVFAGAEQVGDVVVQEIDPLAIVGPAGSEHVFADALAIDPGVENPSRGDEKSRGFRRGVERKLAPQIDGGRRVAFVAAHAADPSRARAHARWARTSRS